MHVHSWAYQQARKRILAGKPDCFWGCGRPATTADHYPPRKYVGDHLNLVPACRRCNYGHVAEKIYKASYKPSRKW